MRLRVQVLPETLAARAHVGSSRWCPTTIAMTGARSPFLLRSRRAGARLGLQNLAAGIDALAACKPVTPHARQSAAPSRRQPGGAHPSSTGFMVKARGAAPSSYVVLASRTANAGRKLKRSWVQVPETTPSHQAGSTTVSYAVRRGFESLWCDVSCGGRPEGAHRARRDKSYASW